MNTYEATYNSIVITNELHAVLKDTSFDFGNIECIIDEIVSPILKIWNNQTKYHYISALAVDWITDNILPQHKKRVEQNG